MGNSSSSSLPLAGQQPDSSMLPLASEMADIDSADQAAVQHAVDRIVKQFLACVVQSQGSGNDASEAAVQQFCSTLVEEATALVCLPSKQYSFWTGSLQEAFEQQSEVQQQLGNKAASHLCLAVAKNVLPQLNVKRAAMGLQLKKNFDDEPAEGSVDGSGSTNSNSGGSIVQPQQQQQQQQQEQGQVDPAATDAAGWPLLHRVVMLAVSQAPPQQQQQQQQQAASAEAGAGAAAGSAEAGAAAQQAAAGACSNGDSSSSSKLAGSDAAAAAAASSGGAATAGTTTNSSSTSSTPAGSNAAAAAAAAVAAAAAASSGVAATAGTTTTTNSSSSSLPSLQEVLSVCDDVDMLGPGGFTALHLACAGPYSRVAK
jgi:hypothetical protein